jgi:hypothetical protein
MIVRVGACPTQTIDVDHFLGAITTELVKTMELEAAGVLACDEHGNDFRWRQLHDQVRILVGDG